MKTERCDVLVIGSGGAALRAAIAAQESRTGSRVVLLTKGTLGKSGVTAKACSDRMAFHATLPYTAPGGADNWKYHAADVYRIGGFVSDEDLAVILAKGSAAALNYLVQLGVPFQHRTDGTIDQFVTDGSDYPRAAYTGPDTAIRIEQGLLKRLQQLPVIVTEHCLAVSLLKSGVRVCGALAIDERPPFEPILVTAGAVVLATGGAGQIFAQNVFPPENTGEGFSLALEAGAELVNMEFIQFGPASLATKFNCSGSMFRAIPRLVDETGNELLPAYIPETPSEEQFDILFRKGASWPVSCEKDTCSIDLAMFRARDSGHRVFLDYSRNPQGFCFDKLTNQDQQRYRAEMTADLGQSARDTTPLNRLKEINPQSIAWFKGRGIDLDSGTRIEVGVCAQHFQGGIKIRTQGDTCVPGLFAAGECAGGQHGANRPGGHALLDCQVFGRIAGESAAKFTHDNGITEADNFSRQTLAEKMKTGRGLPATEVRTVLQSIVSTSASVFRTKARLLSGIEKLLQLRREGIVPDESGLPFALETSRMFDTAEAVMKAALMRDESRGPHLRFSSETSRELLPRNDNKWKKYIVIRKGCHGLELRTQKPIVLNSAEFQSSD